MEPKKIIAPPIPLDEKFFLPAGEHCCGEPTESISINYEWNESELAALRKHIDEAKNDPDYAVIYTPQPEE
jgi:hypothetical protein